jgi:uncharacterized delta-60 repeat protein
MRLIFTPLLTFLCIFSFGQAGSLQTSFGTGGKVSTDIEAGHDYPHAMVVQDDGRLVVVGESVVGSYFEFAIVRYNTNGTLDNSFNGNGKLTLDLGTGNSVVEAVAIQDDGKIVVAGTAYNGSNEDFAIARFNADGTLDNTFDLDGTLTMAFGTGNDVVYDIAIQTDGKILVAGYTVIGSTQDFALVRFNADGSLDTSFDTDGKATTDFSSRSDIIYDMTLQPDGKIMVVGVSAGSFGFGEIVFARYNTNGSQDFSFGSGGKATLFLGGGMSINSLALQADGKIVGVGSNNNGSNYDFLLVRFTAAGVLDNSFSDDGIVFTPVGPANDFAHTAQLQSDGKIVVAGSAFNVSNLDFALVRYNADGTPDNTFNGNGKAFIDFGGDDNSVAMALKGTTIYSAGYTFPGGSYGEFALAATQNDAFPLPITLSAFTATWESSNAVRLNWQTQFEQNTERFEIERSTDGRQFTTIGSVKASGSSTSEKSYHYVDFQSLSPINYYRLKTVDADNKISYSQIVMIRTTNRAKLEVYPNPAKNSLQVQFTSSDRTLFIYDIAGRAVKTVMVNQRGTVSLVLDISDLKQGVYIVKSGNESVRLVKQ